MGEPAPLAVAYDEGAVSPAEIAVGVAGLAPVAFVLPHSPHVRKLRPVLSRLGRVVQLTGRPERDAVLLRRLAPAGVLTFSESLLRVTAGLARTLGLPHHTPEVAEVLTDKYRQRERLAAAGVDTVRCRPVPDVAAWEAALSAVGLPAVVKPVHGQGSRGTFAVHDRADADRVRSRLFDGPEDTWVVEELLRGRPSGPFGDYVSVETATGPDGTEVLAVTGKHPLTPPFRETGQFWPAALPHEDREAVSDLAVRAVTALGVTTGVCHTEVKLTPGGPRIIEVNGRLGGHLNELSRRACGVDLVRVAALLALGAPPPPAPAPPGRVYFQFNGLAPVRPGRLRALTGGDEIRRLEGITGHRPYVRPGDDLPGGVGSVFMDLLTGDAPDHPAMVELLDRALPLLRYEFTDGATTWVESPRRAC
ncbi:ATP-grasp domain-containing protein [Streptomyces huiliensis]|uniref:ATP-grasp domain-containing protein n=1 Tax=Streptomyces huiliensis TaxID=2876027 RepID=UPI001CBDF2EF|nr:ATP-grasp domain-containing protein [Streptomyces huiliensis]MBZ4321253.1 ATP-grasp domain-containing protein [Streptomyces huiliensis]